MTASAIKLKGFTMTKKTIPLFISLLTVCAGVFCFSPVRAYADINGNESRVIAAAGQQFYYGGEYYQATDSALNELYSKLDDPDTDLSGSQAEEALDRMYANIGTGVAEGYLVKVGGGQDPTTPTQDPTTPVQDPTNPVQNPANPIQNPANPEQGTTNPIKETTDPAQGKTNPIKETTDPAQGKTNPAQGKTNPAQGTTTPAQETKPGTNPASGTGTKPGTTAPLTVKEIAAAAPGMSPERQALLDRLTGLTQGQREAVISDFNDKYEKDILRAGNETLRVEARLATGSDAIQENGNTGIWNAISDTEWYEGIKSELLSSRPEQTVAKKSVIYDSAKNTLLVNDGTGGGTEEAISFAEFFPYRRIRIFLFAAAIAALLIGTAGLAVSLLSDRKGVGHHKKSAMKRTAGIITAVAAGLNLFVFGVSAGFGAGLISSSTLMQMINSSGFHQYAYEAMNAKAQQILMLADYDEDALAEPLSFTRFQFLSKQDTMDVINGKKTTADLSTLKSEIVNTLESNPVHGEEVNTVIADEVMKTYQKALTGDEIHFIKEVRDSLKTTVLVTFFLSILGLLICVFSILRDEGHAGRNLRQAGIAMCAVAAAFLAGYAITSAGSYEGKAYISPEYLYIFMIQVVGRLKNLWLICTVFGAAAGAALIFGSFKLKTGR